MYNSAAGREAIGLIAYDFYRCRSCLRLVTQPELVKALGPDGTGSACACGGTMMRGTNLTWRDRLLPRVWGFAVARAWELGVRGIWRNLTTPVPADTSDPTPPPGVDRAPRDSPGLVRRL